MNDIEKAKNILHSENHTCVLCKGDIIYIDNLRGIAPMINYIDNNIDLKDFSAADKIIGKAAAMLFCLAGVKEVYADVMSSGAADFLRQNNIVFSYGTLADKIINRKGDGICPMEQVAENIDNPQEAYTAIKAKLLELRKDASK